MYKIMKLGLLLIALQLQARIQVIDDTTPVTIAILAKDKGHCLPFYLSCLELQTWPAEKTYIYIRTNNNNDNTRQILSDWVEKVKDRYLEVYFDDSDVPFQIECYKQHEWNAERFKILGNIRTESLYWAMEKKSHYFVADCDNFILPHTIEAMVQTGLPIVAPMLHTHYAYSNLHAAVDANGYYIDSPFYLPLVNQQLKGLVQVPVVHCTYFIRHDIIKEMSYDDESYRYEYVIFSDNARKKNIPQYFDNREVYGYLTFAENAVALVSENWFIDFCNKIYSYKYTA